MNLRVRSVTGCSRAEGVAMIADLGCTVSSGERKILVAKGRTHERDTET